MKTVDADELLEKPWCDDTISRSFLNILRCSIALQRGDMEDEKGEGAFVCACTNCFNCMTRRIERGVCILPIQEVKWRIETLHKVTKKSMDSRILLRLACALTERHDDKTNYYMNPNIFDLHTQQLIISISKCESIAKIDALLARNIVLQNGDPPFMTNNKTVEFIREHYKKEDADDSTEQEGMDREEREM